MFNLNKKPKTPKSPASPTVGDLFQAERPSNFLSNNDLSPTIEEEPQQDQEERFGFQPIKKISVIAKVKEKARKWKQNLGRKKPGQDTDPASDDYEKDEDTPRHESPSKLFTLRRSSSSNKEGMRLRATPGFSFNEKQVLSYSADRGYSEHCQKIMHNKRLPILRKEEDDTKPTVSLIDELPSCEEVVEETKEEKPMIPQEESTTTEDEKATTTELESEETDEEAKVMPLASPETIEEAQELSQICMKLIDAEKGRAPTPSPEEGAFEVEMQGINSPPTQMRSLVEAVTEKLAPAVSDCGSVDSEETQKIIDSEEQEQQVSSVPAMDTCTRNDGSSVSGVDGNDHECRSGERKWDKGVSVKEFIRNKLEPGDDARALSQVISEAISPRRTPGDKGVIEKVKEAVTLLLLAEQHQMEQEEEEDEEEEEKQEEEEAKQEQSSASHLLRHSSSSLQIPISTNAYEDELDVEEESQGRILQAN